MINKHNRTDNSIATITVQEAIHRGVKIIALPSKIILTSATVLSLLLLLGTYSWSSLLIIPLGVLLSLIYTPYATSRWKVWAYRHVNDIHQLQRSAELAGLLLRMPGRSAEDIANEPVEEPLKTLQKRFLNEPGFIDDHSIPQETCIYTGNLLNSKIAPCLTLSNRGIHLHGEGFMEWGKIKNERIATVTHSRMNAHTGRYSSPGSANLFRFEYPSQNVELPMASLAIEVWKLDLLLYIYRGRFTSGTKTLIRYEQEIIS